jgi:hypothetical protein
MAQDRPSTPPGGGIKNFRKKPENWLSSTQIHRTHKGGLDRKRRMFFELQTRLTSDLVAAGYSEEEAAELVKDHLLDIRKPRTGKAGIAASPDALRLLQLVKKTESPGPRPEGWRSAAELVRDYRGSVHSIKRRILHLREQLLFDVSEALSCSPEIAASWVEEYMIGERKSRGLRGGSGTLMISPDILRLAVADGWLTSRVSDAARSP